MLPRCYYLIALCHNIVSYNLNNNITNCSLLDPLFSVIFVMVFGSFSFLTQEPWLSESIERTPILSGKHSQNERKFRTYFLFIFVQFADNTLFSKIKFLHVPTNESYQPHLRRENTMMFFKTSFFCLHSDKMYLQNIIKYSRANSRVRWLNSEYSRVRWLNSEYSRVRWLNSEYSRVRWLNCEYSRVRWLNSEYSRVRWLNSEYSRVRWFNSVYSRVRWLNSE
jgi:hypothetical protein